MNATAWFSLYANSAMFKRDSLKNDNRANTSYTPRSTSPSTPLRVSQPGTTLGQPSRLQVTIESKATSFTPGAHSASTPTSHYVNTPINPMDPLLDAATVERWLKKMGAKGKVVGIDEPTGHSPKMTRLEGVTESAWFQRVMSRWRQSQTSSAAYEKWKSSLVSTLTDVKVERYGKKRLILSLIYFVFCGYVAMLSVNFADMRRDEFRIRNINIAALPDMGHDLIPEIRLPHLPDYFILGVVLRTLALIVTHQHRLLLLRRFFYVYGSLLLFRSLLIVVTTLPDPSHRCAGQRAQRSLTQSFDPLFGTTCGDLMFSGHTVLLVLLTKVCIKYGSQVRWHKWCTKAFTFCGVLSLLAARYHYTIDVLIAWFLADKIWDNYDQLAKAPLLQGPVMRFLERRSSENDLRLLVTKFKDSLERDQGRDSDSGKSD